MKGKNIRKLAAFMATVMAMASVGTMSVSAISINCPVEGKWVSMSSTAEGTKWFMADGSVVTEDKNGNITQTAPTKPATTTTASSGASNASTSNTVSSSGTTSDDSWIPDGYTVDPSIKNNSYNHILEQLIFDYTNEERVKAGLPELVWSKGLTEYAEIRAKEIVNKFEHTRPNNEFKLGGGENIYLVGISLCDISNDKNITLQEVAQKAVNWWMNSPGHKAAIMDYEVDEYGDVWGSQSMAVGVYINGGCVYAVQVFNADSTSLLKYTPEDFEDPISVSPLLTIEDLERYTELIKSN